MALGMPRQDGHKTLLGASAVQTKPLLQRTQCEAFFVTRGSAAVDAASVVATGDPKTWRRAAQAEQKHEPGDTSPQGPPQSAHSVAAATGGGGGGGLVCLVSPRLGVLALRCVKAGGLSLVLRAELPTTPSGTFGVRDGKCSLLGPALTPKAER